MDSSSYARAAVSSPPIPAIVAFSRACVRRHTAQRAFLGGYQGDPTVPDRARRYEALFLARAAARRLSPADDDWEARTTGLTEVAGGLFRERVA